MSENWFADPVEGEVSYEEIQQKADNGDFHEWNFSAFDFTENGYEDVIDKLKQYSAVEYLDYEEKYKKAKDAGNEEEAKKWKAEMDRMVNEVYDIYRSKNIYPTLYFSEMGVLQEIERCIAYKAFWDGDTVSCVSGDTEFFNGQSWVPIKDYNGIDPVLQFVPDEFKCELVRPNHYIHKEGIFDAYDGGMFHPFCVTGDHNMAIFDDTDLLVKRQADEIYNEYEGCIGSLVEKTPNQFTYNVVGMSATVDEIIDVVNSIIDQKPYTESSLIEVVDREVRLSDLIYRLSLTTRDFLLSYILEKCDIGANKIRIGTDWNTKAVYNLICMSDKYYGYSFIFTPPEVPYGDYMNPIASHLERSWRDYDYIHVDMLKKVKIDGKYCFNVPSGYLVLRRKGMCFVTGNCGSGVGTTLCKFLFPNLQDTPSKHDLDKTGAESIFAKFNNEQYLKRAIRFCYSYKNGFPVPTAVEGGLRLVGSAPSNFRPMNAKAVYERFCPEGGTIYDFCCVSADTEYFNGKRWKPISEYIDGEKVLQFNDDNTATLVLPEEYIHYESDDPFYEYTGNVEMPSCQTGNHDVVYFDKDTKTYKKIKQSEVLNGFDGLIPTNCVYEGNLTLTDLEISNLVRSLLNPNNDREELFETGYSLTIECRHKLLRMILPPKDFPGLKLYTKFGGNTELKDFCCSLARLSGLCASSGRDSFTLLCNKKYRGEGTDGAFHIENAYSKYLINCEIPELYGTGVRHCNAKFVERHEKGKYCFVVPSHMLVLRRKGKVYVTGNCGFGGRMLGALSSSKNFRYVGTDPNTETMYHLHQLGEYIEQVTGREDSYELHCCGSEDFCGPAGSIDFAFSSPPYFDLEVYSDEPTQCYNKFPKLEDWLEGYVRQTIKNIGHMLKPGACYAVNIADFKVGTGGECAYVDEWIRLSTEEGMPLFDTVYLGVTARAGSKEQAAGELKKENILIFRKGIGV